MALYDLEADPSEQHNVAAAHPDIVKRLKAGYDAYADEFQTAKKNAGAR
jgi:hypothetical protein